jgi:glycosyltransferase involved in cell wall biosynthesis
VAVADHSLTVLHVNTERGWRGGDRQTLWLADSLRREGHRSLVAARPDQPLAIKATGLNLPVVRCSPVTEFDPIAVFKLRRVVRQHGVHIVHAHTSHALTLGALATIGTPARLVVTRRVDFRVNSNLGSRWKYAQADAIIAISDAVARVLVEGGIPRERIEVIPSGVDLSRVFLPASRETLARVGVPPGSPIVVQVAQLVGHKDPVTFVRAIARARQLVPSLHALLVGDGPLRSEVERAIVELGLRGVVHLTGYRKDADSLLAAATVATLSSSEEGLGTVLLDAMSMGKPIAATTAGGIPEIIENGASGLLAPVHDADRLGANIAALLTDLNLADRLSRAARARANEFSIERTAKRTLEVYSRLRRDK